MSMIAKGIVKPYPQYEQYTKKDGSVDYKQTMLIETFGQYPKLIAMKILGSEKINDILTKWLPGAAVEVHFNAESREYQGKYYTDLTVWKVENGSATAAPAGAPQAPAPAPQPQFQQPAQPLQAAVNHAQQNYQVQPIRNGYGWVHPHTGQPMNPPAPVQPQAPQAPQAPQQAAPAPAPMAPAPQPQQQFQPQPAAPQAPAPIPAAPPAPQNVGQPMNGQAWNTDDMPF